MRLKTKVSFAAALLYAASAGAQSNEALSAAAQKAISSNPEVTARFNAYRASADAIDAARGGFYPRLDLSANVGQDKTNIEGRQPDSQTLNRSGAALTLTQLLWDGLTTRNEVGRLGHERLARYFELLDVTEQTALEAARAYYDVLRFRRLVKLAEDNYVQHRSAFNQIQSRFKAGVGRGVDLEQAGARLALAESNLSTEVANLHDVAARYQRVIGDAPPKNLPLPARLTNALPANALDAAADAVRRSPAISASIESLRSARALASSREGVYQPKIEARVRSGGGKNFDGIRDQKTDSTAEIVVNWNLYNGGADQARIRQQVNLMNQAADLRDKACRDARQVVAIAFNDTRKLAEQLQYLDRNTLAIEKARDAYRQQFDIGQRSLLDLLNSENELYTARRSYANADYDLAIAYARTQASMNQLGTQLGLTRSDTTPESPVEANGGWSAGEDGPTRCPAVAVEVQVIDMAALDRRASAGVSGTAPLAPSSTTSAPLSISPASIVMRRLNDWVAAWESKDVNRYLSFYSPGFASNQGTSEAWRAKRRVSLAKKGVISVKLENVQTNTTSPDSVETSFQQTYTSSNFSDVVTKVLTWQRINGDWMIIRESDR